MINIKEDNTQFIVNVQDIPVGGTFKYNGEYYLKTDSKREIRSMLAYGTDIDYGILNLSTGVIEYDYYTDVIPVEIDISTKLPNINHIEYTHHDDFLFYIPVGTPFMYKENYYIKTNLEQSISEDPGAGKLYGIVDILTGKLTYEDGYERVVWIDIDATVRVKTK